MTNGKLPTRPEHQVRNVSVVTALGPFESLYMMTEEEFDEVMGLDNESEEKGFEPMPLESLERVRTAPFNRSNMHNSTPIQSCSQIF